MRNVSILVTALLYSSQCTCQKSHKVLVQELKENSIHFKLARFYIFIVQQMLYFFPEMLLFLQGSFCTDVVSLCQHHDRFDQFWMECPEISSHILEFTVSAQVPCLNLDEIISGGDPLRCLQWKSFGKAS